MYLISTLNKEQIKKDLYTEKMLTDEQLDGIVKCEIWGTSFKDAGEYCEFRFFKNNAHSPCITRQINGY